MSGIKIDPREKLQTLTALRQMIVRIEAMPEKQSCESCTHYCPPTILPAQSQHTIGGPVQQPGKPRPAYCNKWKNDIPPQVLPDGCGAGWEFDDIPF